MARENEIRKGEVATLFVQGLDRLDGASLPDLKPERSGFIPVAPPQPGDFQVAPCGPSNVHALRGAQQAKPRQSWAARLAIRSVMLSSIRTSG